MPNLNPTGQKFLEFFHLLFAMMWIGGAIGMTLLRLHLPDNADATEMFALAYGCRVIDDLLIIPGAIGCLLTGILYSCLTKWGWFKHGWITCKWVITIFVILFGTFATGPIVRSNLDMNPALTYYHEQSEQFWTNVSQNAIYGYIQLTCLTIALLLSVFKPFKNKKIN